MDHDEEFWNNWLKENKSIITYNADGSIDVDGNVIVCDKKLTKIIPKFNIVNGYFICSNNQLTSLENSPKETNKDFWCHHNQLTSLEYSPQIIKGWLICNSNPLKSFYGLNVDGIQQEIILTIEKYNERNVNKQIIKAIQNDDRKWLLLNVKNYTLDGYRLISKYLKGELFS